MPLHFGRTAARICNVHLQSTRLSATPQFPSGYVNITLVDAVTVETAAHTLTRFPCHLFISTHGEQQMHWNMNIEHIVCVSVSVNGGVIRLFHSLLHIVIYIRCA